MRQTTDQEMDYIVTEKTNDIAGSYSGTIAIFGGGKNMWDEWSDFMELCDSYHTMAVNVAGMFIPKLDHLFSLHNKNIAYISKWRKVEYGKVDKHITHATKLWDGVDYAWSFVMLASTSGLMASVLAKVLGYDKIVLIGVPMDNSGYFYKPMLNECFPDKCRLNEIRAIRQRFGDNIRSMSGRTREILGEPTQEWLEGEENAS